MFGGERIEARRASCQELLAVYKLEIMSQQLSRRSVAVDKFRFGGIVYHVIFLLSSHFANEIMLATGPPSAYYDSKDTCQSQFNL